jgi:hypothetical protein
LFPAGTIFVGLPPENPRLRIFAAWRRASNLYSPKIPAINCDGHIGDRFAFSTILDAEGWNGRSGSSDHAPTHARDKMNMFAKRWKRRARAVTLR